MTLRQFSYLAGGAVCGFLIIKFFPLPALLKWPIAAIFTFSGLAFAFLPIQERPLDKWLIAFIKSVNSPTQYLWQKEARIPDVLLRTYYASSLTTLPKSHQLAHEDAKKKLEMYLSTLPQSAHQTINIREKNYLDKTLNLFSQEGGGITAPLPVGQVLRPSSGQALRTDSGQVQLQPISQQPSFKKTETPISSTPINIQSQPVKIGLGRPVVANVKSAAIGKNEIKDEFISKILDADIKTKKEEVKEKEEAKPAIQPIRATVDKPTPTEAMAGKTTQTAVGEDKEKLDEIIKEKQKLEQELQTLKEQLDKSKMPPGQFPQAAERPSKPKVLKPQLVEEKLPTIKTVTPKTAVNVIGIPKLPQVPNLIMGVIKDTQDKQLPNIILTVKDTKGVPQRALKTNRLGQFSTATPLQNGTYYIEAEDPLKRYVFDIAEINLTGKVFLPIEMDAKGEKELIREKLTKEIFGSKGAAA